MICVICSVSFAYNPPLRVKSFSISLFEEEEDDFDNLDWQLLEELLPFLDFSGEVFYCEDKSGLFWLSMSSFLSGESLLRGTVLRPKETSVLSFSFI